MRVELWVPAGEHRAGEAAVVGGRWGCLNAPLQLTAAGQCVWATGPCPRSYIHQPALLAARCWWGRCLLNCDDPKSPSRGTRYLQNKHKVWVSSRSVTEARLLTVVHGKKHWEQIVSWQITWSENTE